MPEINPTVDDLIEQRDAIAKRSLDLELAIVARDRRIRELEAQIAAASEVAVP